MRKYISIMLVISFLTIFSCAQKKGVKYLRTPIPSRSNVAIIIDCPNNIKNVVMTKFMQRGFRVKALNASDLYSLNNVFDIKDFKYIAYKSSSKGKRFGSDSDSLLSTQKSYDNIYKLHVYNFEANKAKILSEMRSTWDVRYLILLELQDWEETSWARAIDLDNYNLMYIENYPAKYSDNLEDVVDHFIKGATRRR